MEMAMLSNMKQELKWVNVLNMQCQTHHVYIEAPNKCVKCKTNSNPQVHKSGATKNEGLKRGLETMESCDYQMSESSMFLFVRSSFRLDVISFHISET